MNFTRSPDAQEAHPILPAPLPPLRPLGQFTYFFQELALVPCSHGVLASGDATIEYDAAGNWRVADVSLPPDFHHPNPTVIDASHPQHRPIRDALQLRYASNIQDGVDADLVDDYGIRSRSLDERLTGRELGVGTAYLFSE